MSKKGQLAQNSRVNFTELLERVDGDRELLRELLGIFKREFPRVFQQLRQAVAEQDSLRTAGITTP
jgi:HPt (histidine-containing phosphotransfer) domain-containing protein